MPSSARSTLALEWNYVKSSSRQQGTVAMTNEQFAVHDSCQVLIFSWALMVLKYSRTQVEVITSFVNSTEESN